MSHLCKPYSATSHICQTPSNCKYQLVQYLPFYKIPIQTLITLPGLCYYKCSIDDINNMYELVEVYDEAVRLHAYQSIAAMCDILNQSTIHVHCTSQSDTTTPCSSVCNMQRQLFRQYINHRAVGEDSKVIFKRLEIVYSHLLNNCSLSVQTAHDRYKAAMESYWQQQFKLAGVYWDDMHEITYRTMFHNHPFVSYMRRTIKYNKLIKWHKQYEMCSICYSKPCNAQLLPCRHSEFCAECVVRMRLKNKPTLLLTCPFCRSDVVATQLIEPVECDITTYNPYMQYIKSMCQYINTICKPWFEAPWDWW